MKCVFVDLVVGKVEDKKCKDDVIKVIRTAIMSKQYGLEDFLASIVVESCSKYLPCSVE